MRSLRRYRTTRLRLRRVMHRLLATTLFQAGFGSPREPLPSARETKGSVSRDGKRTEAWIHTEDREKGRVSECHRCLVPVVRLSNVFGLLPLCVVDGVFRFSWCHLVTWYSYLVAALLTGFSLTRVVALIGAKEAQRDWVPLLTATVFYLLGATGSLLLFQLARDFPDVMKRWACVEKQVGVPYSCKWKVGVCLVAVMLSAAGETTTSMFHDIPTNTTTDFWVFLESYVYNGHKYEVDLLGYSNALGLAILIINKYATFVWNFNDVLISSVAIVLCHLVRAYNMKLRDGSSTFDASRWRAVRQDHLALLTMVRALDGALGPLVLQSYLTNIFFTLVQLYFGIRQDHPLGLVSKLYLTWSFLHLLGRLLLVSFSCAKVHETATKGAAHILMVPESRYCLEAWRLQQQIQTEVVGLSGCGFFLVNKSFILAMTGALVTYEVILLQFNVGKTSRP